MTRLYADEQFPRVISEHLRAMEHDVLTVQQAGNAGDSDPEVLAFAIADDRAVAIIQVLERFGILEIARTGKITLTRQSGVNTEFLKSLEARV
jgi:acetolactate synthase small subunit